MLADIWMKALGPQYPHFPHFPQQTPRFRQSTVCSGLVRYAADHVRALFTLLVVAVAITPLTHAQPVTPPTTSSAPPSSLTLGPEHREAYLDHAAFLADPALQGRLPGTPGIERAAAAAQLDLAAAGLQPLFQDAGTGRPTFRQQLDLGTRRTLGNPTAALIINDQQTPLEHGTDFSLLGYGSGGAGELPLTFVGYSIVAGPEGYIGYTLADRLDGRAVIILRYEPMDDDGLSLWAPSGQAWSGSAGAIGKARAAARRGAAAVLFVTPPAADTGDPLETLDETTAPAGMDLDIPAMQFSADAAASLIAAADPEGRSLNDLIALANRAGTVVQLNDNARLRFDADLDQSPLTSANIGALLPGRGDLAERSILIGAHYDHIGLGTFASRSPDRAGEVHPGADDNASGTAGLLLAADVLAAAYAGLPADADARSIIFVLFTAEESGLVGSAEYTNNPPRPIRRHDLMLNMDMIGRYEDLLEVGGLDSADGLEDLLTPLFDASPLNILPDSFLGAGRSDHASFHRAAVPAVFFHTGLHDQYHTADDTIDTLNIDGALDVVELVCQVALTAATHPGDLPYNGPGVPPADPDEIEDGRPRVQVGIATRDSPLEQGFRIARVADGSPAERAGLRPGDRVTAWNGQPVADVEAWLELLIEHQPGDRVTVTIIRAGQQQTLELELDAIDD